MPWLICTSGDDRGLQLDLGKDPITIGRAPDAEMRIIDDRASRYHCKVHWLRGKLMVEDLNSTNGIKFKGKRYQGKRIKLNEGESFAIGSDVFTFSKSKDAYLEAAEDIMSEFNRRRDQSSIAERTYTEALSAELKRKKRGRFNFLSFLFPEKDDKNDGS